ncbi:MAG TPA: PQQ-binding-like beta-propeller repeat protein [Vicinamibacteria bacterium]
MSRVFVRILVVAAAAGGLGAAAPTTHERFWPSWRGPAATGEGPTARPPVEWSETKNVRWKVEIPGRGQSSPVVWGDLVFLTSAVPTDKGPAVPRPAPPAPASGVRAHPEVSRDDRVQAFTVFAVGRSDGKVRWSRVVREAVPHEGTHKDGSLASGSVTADAQRVVASFGSYGLYCLDHKGKVLWDKQIGEMKIKLAFGEGSSPVLHGDRLIVNSDHEGPSFTAVFDAKTGKELWRKERDERTSWSTPLVVAHGGRRQVVVSATKRVRSYDLDTGELLWDAGGMTDNAIPSPVAADGLVYVTSGFRGSLLLAVRLDEAKGSLAGPPGIAWSYDKDTPYVPSPLLYQGALYFLKSNNAILTRLDARTGEKQWSERIEGVEGVYASPVAADGRIYVVGRNGVTATVRAGATFEVLAKSALDDGFDASPALVDGEVYLRGRKSLYRISAD